MRILVVSHYQPPHYGGIETVAAALVERYSRAGHETVWLSSDVPPTPPAPGQVRVAAWNGLEDVLGVPYPIWSPAGIAITHRLVDWCDVAHCHDCLYPGTVLAIHHARRRDKRTLLTQHVGPVPYRSPVLRGIQSVAYATLGRAVHRRADQVVFISRAVRDWFARRVAYRRPPRFLANGADTALFTFGSDEQRREARQRIGVPAAGPVVLFVGRFVEKKGTPIVEQLARLSPQSTFLLIGEGPIEPGKWNLPNVRVLPFQPQATLREYYWASDVLLLPSTGEGFPLVVIEAMASGCPAIISPDTFAAWDDGRQFFFVSEPNATAIAAVLAQFDTTLDPAHRQAVASYAQAHWNWDRVAAEYLQLLEQLRR